MKLTEKQLKTLISAYALNKKQTHFDLAHNYPFSRAINFIEKEFGDYFNLQAISEDETSSLAETKLFYEFLYYSLNYNERDKQVDFSPSSAQYFSTLLHPRIDVSTPGKLHHEVANLGIREKYLKNTLGTQEWLTTLDLERMLGSMELRDRIHVTRFNAAELGMQLHAAREAHPGSTPYSIPLLLNKGTEGRRTGDHFFAVVITVNPADHTISYRVNDSLPLTEAQKQDIEKTLEAAIKFKVDALAQGVKKVYQAFPDNWISVKEKNKIEGGSTSLDSYSNGYRALHTLLNAPELAEVVNGNIKAAPYANCAKDTISLVKLVYKEQLENLIIAKEQIEGLDIADHFIPAMGQVDKRKIALTKINEFLGYIDSQVPSIVQSSPVNPTVIKKLSEYNQFLKTISFPVLGAETLSLGDYEEFFLQLHGKLIENKQTLDKLVLSPCSPKTLDGLIVFLANKKPLRFNELSLDLSNMKAEEVAAFIIKFKTLLPNLSENELKKLTIMDTKSLISEAQWRKIATLVKERGVTVDLLLPIPLQTSTIQRDIDQSVSTNKFNRVQKEFSQPSEAVDAGPLKSKKKRTRPRLDPTLGLSVDIEQQQQQQTEVAVEVKREKVQSLEKGDFGDLDVLAANSFSGFLERFNAGRFNIPMASYLFVKANPQNMWNNWFGHITLDSGREILNKALSGMTAQACEQLLKYSKKFSSGFDLAHLPLGFVLVDYPVGTDNRVLHYDKNLALLQKADPLAPALKDQPKAEALAYPVFIDLIEQLRKDGSPEGKIIAEQWDKLQGMEYDSEAVKLFQKHLPMLVTLKSESLRDLFTLTFGKDLKGPFNKEAFDFISNYASDFFKLAPSGESDKRDLFVRTHFSSLENVKMLRRFGLESTSIQNILRHDLKSASSNNSLLEKALSDNPKLLEQLRVWKAKIPSLNFDALLQVYSQGGAPGLTTLISSWDSADLHGLKMLHDTLFCHAASYMPLLNADYQEAITAVSGFSGAKKEWWDALLKIHGDHAGYDDLPTLLKSFKQFSQVIEEKGLSFYSLAPGSFKDVKSMPVALARMVTILNQCRTVDVNAQWMGISQLSLASTGAIRAITDAQQDNRHCGFVVPEMRVNSSVYDESLGYRAAGDWKAIGKKATIDEVKQEFYRALAAEKKSLPLSFYQNAFAAIEKKSFPHGVKAKLAALLIASATGAENSLFLDTDRKSLEQWQQILDTISNFSIRGASLIPGAMDKARADFISSLYVLRALPSLPVLGKLVNLIVNSIQGAGLTELPAKLRALNKTCQELNIATTHYGSAIYEGMRFYGDEDYNRPSQTSIFYSHVKTTLALMGYRKEGDLYWHVETDQRKLLISLISTFQIEEKDVDALLMHAEVFEAALGKRAVEYTLYLLMQISKNEPRLTASDLTGLFTNLMVRQSTTANYSRYIPAVYKSFVEQYLEEHMAAYYPDNFFEKLRSVGIDKSIDNLIVEKFGAQDKDQVIAVLNHFLQPGENASYMTLINKIIDITAPMSGIERKNFLNNLQRVELYQTTDPSGTLDIVAFNQLLNAISERGHANDFIYLLAQEESKNVDGLAAKATLYLTTILPGIEKNKSATVSKMDALALVAQLLLSSSAESLAAKPRVAREDQEQLDTLTALIRKADAAINSGGVIDLKELQASVETLKAKNSKAFPKLDTLLEQLKELNKPKSVTVEGTTVPAKPGSVSKVASDWFLARLGLKKTGPEVQQAVLPAVIKKESLEAALGELNAEQARRQDYPGVFSDLFQSVYKIAEQYPGAKGLIIDFVTQYIKGHDKKSGSLIENVWNCVGTIKQEFADLNNADIIRSLCFHYSGIEGDLKPENLLSLMREPGYVTLTSDNKKLLLNMVSVLLNNEKHVTNLEFRELVGLCKAPEKGSVFLAQLSEFYKHAPYPSIAQVKEWHEAVKNSRTYEQDLKDKYAVFDKHPCEREIGETDKAKKGNGFIFEDAKKKRHEFHGVSFPEKELREMETETKRVHDLSTEALINEFKQFNQKPRSKELTNAKLVAIAAELLYRSKGKEGGMGSSFEIHTTQYLAILASLKSGHHNTSEIGTGEGKSRIMAINNACQFALGQTIDFVTSDVQLATRDYLEFQSYFGMLGAKTNIISADTPSSEYCIGGINYSDAANLSLFRNKARSMGKGADVIHPDPAKRALMLDEADKTYFDSADTRYNFSSEADESLSGMEWIYPLLVDFFQNDANKKLESLYYNDVDECNKQFFSFVLSQAIPEQVAKLKTLSQAQVETWLDAAVTARSLKFDKHFAIEADITIVTPFGPKIASEAKLIAGGRKSANSKFSFGVHQCLHAHLNMLKNHPERARPGEEVVVSKLAECKQNFNIDAEKQIIYSSGSKNLLDDYKEGTLIAVTGTAGSIIERQEATNLYGGMKFISVPRHNGLHRTDKAVRLTENRDAQVKALVDYILECRRNEQPALIICEDDQKSKKMFAALNKALAAKGASGSIQLINNDLSASEQNKAIKAAGAAGMITVSTEMIGRGVDIKLDKKASKNGLEILATYLPAERDMLQIFGRSGRAGANGGARLVLNKIELKEKLGKSSLNDGFYTSTETYLRQRQALMDRKKLCVRAIVNTKSDFEIKLTNNFFNQFLAAVDVGQRKDLETAWKNYVKEKDQLWDGVMKELRGEMDKINPSPAMVNACLANCQIKIQALWGDLCRKVGEMELRHKDRPDVKPASLLLKEVGKLELDEPTKQSIASFDLKKIVPHEIKIYDKYDPAHDGRAVVYSKSFEKIRAVFRGERNLFADFFAWKAGSGILFPNLRAFWNGHITFKQFLLGSGSNSTADTAIKKDLEYGVAETSVDNGASHATPKEPVLLVGNSQDTRSSLNTGALEEVRSPTPLNKEAISEEKETHKGPSVPSLKI